MACIYLVEDEDAIREAVIGYLQLVDYQVSGFGNLADARKAIASHPPDLILMDVNLPDGDGFLFAKELLAKQPIPLIFISGRESESDRITGFEVGGDDYIVKPFSPKELVLRIAAILKRTSEQVNSSGSAVWTLDGFTLCADELAHRATLNDEPLKLTATEWKILLFLTSNNGTVVTREQILNRCLEYTFEGYDRTVDTHIKNLRAKLGSPDWIETVRGYGYRFAGETAL